MYSPRGILVPCPECGIPFNSMRAKKCIMCKERYYKRLSDKRKRENR